MSPGLGKILILVIAIAVHDVAYDAVGHPLGTWRTGALGALVGLAYAAGTLERRSR